MNSNLVIKGGVEITFEYSRHVGPRFIHGALTLQFDPSLPYEFVSTASWPASDNYEKAIREVVEEILRKNYGGLKNTKVTLKRVGWDVINSCELGFRRAAEFATKAAFEV